MKMFTSYLAFGVAVLAMTLATQSTASAQNGCCEPVQPCCEPVQPCCEQTVSYVIDNDDCCDSTVPSYPSFDIQPNYDYTPQYSTQQYTTVRYLTPQPQYYTTQYQTRTAYRTIQPLSSGLQLAGTRRANRIAQRNSNYLCCN